MSNDFTPDISEKFVLETWTNAVESAVAKMQAGTVGELFFSEQKEKEMAVNGRRPVKIGGTNDAKFVLDIEFDAVVLY